MKKVKVLIVEDEIDIRETISEILVDEGFEVMQAENGKLGYEVFEKNDPDIIVSDIMMPEVDGYGLLNLVRKSRTKNNLIPFIFLTALSQKENVIKGTKLSANDYLVKPIDFEILIAKINEKTASANKIKEDHEYGIANIKSQISSALPDELNRVIDGIIVNCENMISEPYGPFPHRRYKDDLLRMRQLLKKVRSSIHNYLDSEVINKKLNANEEVISIAKFFTSSIEKLPDNFSSKVVFHEAYNEYDHPSVKIDKYVLVSIFKSVLAATVNCGKDAILEISAIKDSDERLVVIFYVVGNLDGKRFSKIIKGKKLEEAVNSQGCYIDYNLDEKKGNNITLTIPSFRIIN